MNWIKVWDIPQDHWVNSDAETYGMWIKLIRRAETKNRNIVIRGMMIEAKRGSAYASENQLATEWGVTRRRVHSFLQKLEQDGMISVQRMSNRYLVIKVSNYAKFQDPPKSMRTTDGQQTDNGRTTDCTTERGLFLTNKQNIQKHRSKNAFANFPQRETNYDELFEEAERCS